MPTLVADRFEIQALAGQGGMGTVFRALDTASGEIVALKIVDAASNRSRFEREAQLLATMSDEGIVGYVTHGALADGRMYLAMEWLAGEPLDARLLRGPLSIEDSLAITRRVAAALAKGNALGIVHRDVKPANIILREGRADRAMLVDFGIARRADKGSITKTGIVVGTPSYMAPEQARGDASVDGRADTFSLGCVLFECLTGVTAWNGEHVVAILAKLLLEPAPRVRAIRHDVPAALDALVAAMLEKRPEKRPVDVVAALDTLGAELPEASTPSLGPAERQFVSVLLVRRAKEAETLAALDVNAPTTERGIDLVALANGAMVGAQSGPEGAIGIARSAEAMLADDPASVIAIASGRAVLAGNVPVGEVIDRAAAMLTAHEDTPGIWMDDATTALVRGRRPDHVLGRVPFVGRDREMALLEATYRECMSDEVASASLVIAPPGIGKSRLRRELVARLDAPTVWLGLTSDLGSGSPFSLLADIVTRSALDDRFLGSLIGREPAVVDAELAAARADPKLLAARVTEAFVTSAIAAAPLLLVLEDVHWADNASIAAIDELLQRAHDHAVMVLAFARPEVQPKLWNARQIALEPLGRKPAERMARALLGEGADVDAIVKRAEGNALFVEELARAFARGEVSELPPTLAAVTEAGILSLEPTARQVLRAGAIIGERFWRDAVAALLGADVDVDACIDDLVGREVLFRAQRSRFAGESELVFRHALVRDAAYAMLTDDDRRLGHALAAAWLAGRVENPALLAYHQERGGLMAAAAESHALAAEVAVNVNDVAAVEEHGARSLACGATGHVRGRVYLAFADAAVWRNSNAEAAARGAQALSLLERASAPWFIAAGDMAVALGKLARTDELLAIVGALDATPANDAAAERHRAIASARAATQLTFVGELAHARALIAGARFEPGDAAVEGALADAEFDRRFASGRILHPAVALGAARNYAAIGDRRGELAQIRNASMSLALLGAHEEGVRVADEAKALPREASALWYSRGLNVAVGASLAGDLAPMITLTDALPVPRAQMGHWLWLANTLFPTDKPAARSYLDRAIDGVKPYPLLYSMAVALYARFAAAAGDGARARILADEATALAKRGLVVIGLNTLSLARAEAYAAVGDDEAAGAALRAGVAEMQACAAELGEFGQVYLERGPSCGELIAAVERQKQR